MFSSLLTRKACVYTSVFPLLLSDRELADERAGRSFGTGEAKDETEETEETAEGDEEDDDDDQDDEVDSEDEVDEDDEAVEAAAAAPVAKRAKVCVCVVCVFVVGKSRPPAYYTMQSSFLRSSCLI